MSLLAIVIPLPLVIRALQRKFDPFEPIVILSLSFFVLFFLRPVAHLAYGEMTYGGMSIEGGFDRALLVAVTGVIAVYIGYAIGAGRGIARRLGPLPSTLKPEATIMVASGLLLVGIVLYALYAEQIGGLAVATEFLRGRAFQQEPVIGQSTAYYRFGLYLAIPATLLLLEAAAAKRRALFVLLSALSTALFVVLITGPRGDRLWLLLLVMAIFVLRYLRAERRPKARTLAVVGVLWFALGITFLSDVRVPAARDAPPIELLKKTAANPFRGWHDFILGGDTEMFAILALETERVPSLKPHQPGLTLVSLATTWIPRRMYPDKVEPTDYEVYAMLFPDYAKISRGGTAPSVFGGFYYDSGFLGVAIGAVLLGILARALYEYLLAHPGSAGARLVFAAMLPFIVVMVRGNPTDTVGRMAFIVFPIIVAVWWGGRREPRAAHGQSVAAAP